MDGKQNDEDPPDLATLPQDLLLEVLNHQRMHPSGEENMEDEKATQSAAVSSDFQEPNNTIQMIYNDMPYLVKKTKDEKNNTVITIVVINDDSEKSEESGALSVSNLHSISNPESSTISLRSKLSESKDLNLSSSFENKEANYARYNPDFLKESQSILHNFQRANDMKESELEENAIFIQNSQSRKFAENFQNSDDVKESQSKRLSKFSQNSDNDKSFQAYANNSVFSDQKSVTAEPSKSDFTLSDDSTGESAHSQRPSKSPWGPPHRRWPEIHFLLNRPNPYFTYQDPMMTTHPNNNSNTVPEGPDEKDNKSEVSSGADKDCDETQNSYCCCNCVAPCAAPFLQNTNPCFVYPMYPMYCFQPVMCHPPGNKSKSSKERGEPLRMKIIKFPPPSPVVNYDSKSERPQRFNSLNSVTAPPSTRPAGLMSQDDNANSDNFSAHSSNTAASSKPIGRRPPTIICYICGQEYGTASIGIHEKQCLKKWKSLNDQLPKPERRPEPVKMTMSSQSPETSADSASGISGKAEYDLSAINDASIQSFQQQYVKCEKCGRTFLPDSLKHHMSTCRGFHNAVPK